VGNAVGDLHPVVESNSGEAAVAGAAHQAADLLDVDQHRHVALDAGLPTDPFELLVEDEAQDCCSRAAGTLGCGWDVDLAGLRRPDAVRTVEQPAEEGVEGGDGEPIDGGERLGRHEGGDESEQR
jgi:hypothetical protein